MSDSDLHFPGERSLDDARATARIPKRQAGGGDARLVARNMETTGAKLDITRPTEWEGLPVPERRWVVPGWIPLGQTTMLSGDGATGKSLLALQLITACATSQKWLGKEVMPCRAIGVFCEDEKSELQRRLDDINRHYGISFRDHQNIELISRVAYDNALVVFDRNTGEMQDTGFMGQIANWAQDFGAQLIVLDSLHDIFSGNENNRVEARRFVQMLTGLARDVEGAVVVCAHPSLQGLNTGTGMSGSTAWNNAVRSRLYIHREKSNDGDGFAKDKSRLTRKKANYAAADDEIRLSWRDGVLIETGSLHGGVVGAINASNDDKLFLELLIESEKHGRPVSDNTRASNYAPRMFIKSPNSKGRDKRDFERAMERLFVAERIRVVDYGRSGDMRKKIVPTEETANLL